MQALVTSSSNAFMMGIVESFGLRGTSEGLVTDMPVWHLVRRDPRLWRLMRKTLRANLLVASIGILARVLMWLVSSWAAAAATTTTTTTSGGGVTSAVLSSDSLAARQRTMGIAGVLLWLVQLGGQWPLYVTFQVAGLLWYSELYMETWTVRKGFVLTNEDGAGLVSSSSGSVGGGGGGGGASSNAAVQLRQQRAKDYWHSVSTIGNRCFPRALWEVSRYTASMAWSMLFYPEPLLPFGTWVVGDKDAVAALQPLAGLAERIEAISEVIFKAVATFLFTLGVAQVEALLRPRALGLAIGSLLNAFLYAFYVFDYRYTCQKFTGPRASVSRQVKHFEDYWAYHVGFGLSTTVLSYCLSWMFGSVVAVCLTSVVYAGHVVISGYAQPVPSSVPLPVFTVWFNVLDVSKRWGTGVGVRVCVVLLLLCLPLHYIFYW